jgi:hypothetical protein
VKTARIAVPLRKPFKTLKRAKQYGKEIIKKQEIGAIWGVSREIQRRYTVFISTNGKDDKYGIFN